MAFRPGLLRFSIAGLVLVLPSLATSQPSRPGGQDVPRPSPKPGEGPSRPYHEEAWEYWWFLNSEAVLDRTKTIRGHDDNDLKNLTSEDRRKLAAALE